MTESGEHSQDRRTKQQEKEEKTNRSGETEPSGSKATFSLRLRVILKVCVVLNMTLKPGKGQGAARLPPEDHGAA